MNKQPWFMSMVLVSLLSACASNEVLFAEYDAYCESGICVATLPTEVLYTKETLRWEPAVYFGYDKDQLADAEKVRIDRNIRVLKQYPELKINLQAFTDSRASVRYNAALSDRRRIAVEAYLLQQGITESRFQSSIAGENLPINADDSVEARIINRRVEMMLLDNQGRPLSIGIDPILVEDETFDPPTPLNKVTN